MEGVMEGGRAMLEGGVEPCQRAEWQTLSQEEGSGGLQVARSDQGL